MSDYLGKFPYKIKEINTFQVQPFQRDTLLFKLDHIRQFRVFVPLLSEVEAYKRQQLEATQYTNLFYLFFIGATFMVMLFAAAQYIQQRDPVFLWYALYLFSLIFVAWRIVEDLNPPFYLTYHFLPWSWTKVFHSAAHFVTYTLFIYYFLKQDDEFPAFMRPILHFVLGVSSIACLIELILMGSDLRYQSWLLYYAFRTIMTSFSFVFLPVSALAGAHPARSNHLGGHALRHHRRAGFPIFDRAFFHFCRSHRRIFRNYFPDRRSRLPRPAFSRRSLPTTSCAHRPARRKRTPPGN